ncbi:hypothetical protein ACFFX1_41565 [Dactylosporangium sucinum]|uniref:Uncharacterized protein n=1 Tax=Dactylosporangium sucinum TaxID=1424081 RepID=A0A917X1R7_9ACTN|nr:hypothetical protein [Dactylosporangium sucinum]GGM59367.1 hypothetical protein GCM10007977_071090 [Dactylosporangium sucinum]
MHGSARSARGRWAHEQHDTGSDRPARRGDRRRRRDRRVGHIYRNKSFNSYGTLNAREDFLAKYPAVTQPAAPT